MWMQKITITCKITTVYMYMYVFASLNGHLTLCSDTELHPHNQSFYPQKNQKNYAILVLRQLPYNPNTKISKRMAILKNLSS